MRRFCKYSGMEIKKHHKFCKECEFLFETDCPQFRLDRHVTTKEFYDWFYENRVKENQNENVSDMAQSNSSEQSKIGEDK